MPRSELRDPRQIEEWLQHWGRILEGSGSMILIGSGGLLWHANQRGITTPLPEASMDVDPVTDDDSVALLAYEAMIGSEFELERGWHVNLMPVDVLRELPQDWKSRASRRQYGQLTVVVPCPPDLLAPKLRRNEPRDRKHAAWARELGLA